LAKVCSTSPDNDACTTSVADELACPCVTFVNPSNEAAIAALEALQQAWDAGQCGAAILCPAVVCVEPPGATCEETSAGSGEACVDSMN
jgi:hypothetical protein